jgi:hypothetical protein
MVMTPKVRSLMKHNVYYDGRVQSLGLNTEEGSATVGVIDETSRTDKELLYQVANKP